MPDQSKTQMIAVGLARCSTDRQEKSIDQQRKEITDWAAATGHELLEVFEDEGISGSELSRPGLDALFEFIEASDQAGVVCAWKRNRLVRPDDPIDGLLLERRIREAGWTIHFIQGHRHSGDSFIDGLVGFVEHHLGGQYLRDLSADTIRGLVSRALEGEVPGGKVPYGYAKLVISPDGREFRYGRHERHRKLKEQRTKWVPGDPSEVETVRRIFARYATDAVGMARLAEELNADRIPSPGGGRWCGGTIRDMILNPVYAGDMVWNRETTAKFCRVAGLRAIKQKSAHKSQRPATPARRRTTNYAANPVEDWIVVPDHHEPLVPRDLFDKAQAVLKRRGMKAPRQRARRNCYPLTGVMRCSRCGAVFYGARTQKKGKAYERYSCSSWRRDKTCAPIGVDGEFIERTILRKLRDHLLPSEAARSNLRAEVLAALQRQLGGESGDALASVGRLEGARDALAGKIDRALERICYLDESSARMLSEKVRAWQGELGDIREELAATRERTAIARDLERAADDIMGTLARLADLRLDAPVGARKAFYEEAVEGIELEFGEMPPRPGRKRVRRPFKRGTIKLNALLAGASSAFCDMRAPRAGFEPAAKWLTATYSTIELPRKVFCSVEDRAEQGS